MPCSQSERKENYHNFRLVSANPQKVQDESKPFEHSSTKKIIDSPSILRYIFKMRNGKSLDQNLDPSEGRVSPFERHN